VPLLFMHQSSPFADFPLGKALSVGRAKRASEKRGMSCTLHCSSLENSRILFHHATSTWRFLTKLGGQPSRCDEHCGKCCQYSQTVFQGAEPGSWPRGSKREACERRINSCSLDTDRPTCHPSRQENKTMLGHKAKVVCQEKCHRKVFFYSASRQIFIKSLTLYQSLLKW